ncbi:HAD-IIIC family phosphatase [Frigoriglobus tundricola]|uniref:HAD-IIIC family phosphatase n=1 Tax=Frigoriglobus tundricola TaxID=2774151 RepID=UPI00148EAE03|nr:HAD-IIIC family phosphatase [Frigoriglobus tundricola]
MAANFTAEPIEPYLRFWLDRLGLTGDIEFAPYNQIIQELLSPNSLLSSNREGINLILIRIEDGVRFRPGGWDETVLTGVSTELARTLRDFADRSAAHTILCVVPPSLAVTSDPARAALVRTLEDTLRSACGGHESLHWLSPEALALYPVPEPHDPVGDRVGHMPYTPALLAAVATAVARRIHALKFPPHKVIALDCDNTLWAGVVGEDGPTGIRLEPGMKALQEFVVAQQAAGMLVCLVSKNAEADVLDAFDARPDFPLRREHLTAWRVNWVAKSRGLAELAEELNVGIDSFIFLDDNPIECAEVRANLPQVLTIQVPPAEQIADLLPHIWAFDRLKVTEEDRKRTLMYRQNADRSRLKRQAGDITEFLAGLELKIHIATPSADQLPRVAQLTQRTNQFNFTTVRRSEAEINRCRESGFECLAVEVSDRFGEYGLVGVMIFAASGDALVIDTMLLSCRVLGRGVEHAMLAHLGQLATDRRLTIVEARLRPTAKNEPAANFLRSVAVQFAAPAGSGDETVYRIPVGVARGIAYRPGADADKQLELARTEGKPAAAAVSPSATSAFNRQEFYTRTATEFRSPGAVLQSIEAGSRNPRPLDTPVAPPRSATERDLTALWSRVLNIAPIGIDDEFGHLGGTSLQCAQLFVTLESTHGLRLPMTTILEAPTVRTLAERFESARGPATRQSLKLLKKGTDSGPALFLVHDGDGETLLYLNLARRLAPDVTVYGIEPHGNDRCPMLHAAIPEMAAYYVARAREVRPNGPYFLGGLCAGGVIAFEMALQLRATGLEVGLVALLDAADARAKMKPFLHTRRRWARFKQSLGRRADGDGAGGGRDPESTDTATAPPEGRGMIHKAKRALHKLSNLVRYEVNSYRRRVAEAAQIRAMRTGTGADENAPTLTVRAVYEYAERLYAPAERLDVPVILVRAGADGATYAPADEPLTARLRDPHFGWVPRLAGDRPALEVIDAPGGHGGILQEPHVGTVATHVQAAIDRVITVRQK